MARLEPFQLETWLAERQHQTRWDFSSTGMGSVTLRRLRDRATMSLDLEDLDLGYGDLSGSVRLREAIARRYHTPDPARVMVTQGAIEANALVLTALLEAGDRVVTFTPGYQQFTSWPQWLGAQVIPWPLIDLFNNAELAPDLAFLKPLEHHPPKLLILNHPHNPTGKRFSRSWLQAVLSWAEVHGTWVLVDEVYRGLQPEPAPSLAASHHARVVVTDSLAKSLGLAGLRIGWIYASPDLLHRCRQIKDFLTISPARPAEVLATWVLEQWPQLWSQRYQDYHVARKHALTLLQGWYPALTPDHLQGGAMVWLPCSDPDRLAHQLLTRWGFLVVPGTCFGSYSAIRLGWGHLDLDDWQACLKSALGEEFYPYLEEIS
ncbi:aminotransferase class I/II-fold pyridoxal phosphate-dependent enzyme [Anthocerotibacter panamensis]|uniref:aminotransferase class I/II-fold pyridoxal phosphate-dependent enzyme n=1 Tax=Anthocerotibacter panamensis TaxID=2857077 RepID=UPI001C403BB3|nr:aminotransferase class I/II-fold pyridoxal phosphate-dependent enzyme [Anthocerotibacter panamensis]